MIPTRGHRQEFTTSFSRLHVIRNRILHMWRSGPVARLPRNILPTTSPTSYYFLRDPNLLTRLSISDQLITQVRAAAMPLLSQSPDYSPLKTESWNRSNLDMKSVQTSPTQYSTPSTPCYTESRWRFWLNKALIYRVLQEIVCGNSPRCIVLLHAFFLSWPIFGISWKQFEQEWHW